MKLMLAKDWRSYSHKIDPAGMLMSEKLDGIRGLWDGKNFISRGEKTFFVPEWFKKGLPNFQLDGEFYLKDGNFEETCSIVMKRDMSNRWKRITYIVFDTPIAGPYIVRMDKVHEAFEKNKPQYAEIIQYVDCINTKHLEEYFDKIVKNGGEGIMLRYSNDEYHRGRTNKLLKMKQIHDAEAVVVDYKEGTGKYVGQTGALMVIMPNGITFKIGSGLTDEDRLNPPKIGETITYKYTDLTKNGVPRHARFFRVRSDK